VSDKYQYPALVDCDSKDDDVQESSREEQRDRSKEARCVKNLPEHVEATERPMCYVPELAARVGPIRAVILQQFHWLLRGGSGRTIEGRTGRWLYNSYAEWGKHFQLPKWKIKEELLRLEHDGYIRSEQPEGWHSRRKSYQLLIGATAPTAAQIAKEARKSHKSGITPIHAAKSRSMPE